MKVFDRGGLCGFYFLLQGDPSLEFWSQIEKDFPVQAAYMKESTNGNLQSFLHSFDNIEKAGNLIISVCPSLQKRIDELCKAEVSPEDVAWLDLYEKGVNIRRAFRSASKRLQDVNFKALRLAVEDLSRDFPQEYSKGQEYLKRIDVYQDELGCIEQALENCEPGVRKQVDEILSLQREALTVNPLIDFDQLLVVKRRPLLKEMPSGGWPADTYGLPGNRQSNCCLKKDDWDNEIAVFSIAGLESELITIYKPEGGEFVGDLDLHFDSENLLFSSIGSHDRWQVFEIRVDGSGLRQVTPGDQVDVDNYDACYLPDERIIFGSTAYMTAVPCVDGSSRAANLYRMNSDGTEIRQLCFDQEHN
jgi:hypothetical protein